MNKTQVHELFKKFIIRCADLYIQDHDLADQDIYLIDDFADVMLDELDSLTTLLITQKG